MTSPIYDRIGRGYATTRRPDPRIARRILDALGGARSVLNVGAGAGSYEPDGARVIAVEPSGEMIAQRDSAAPVVRATAEALPFAGRSFDAAMAVLTIHHWGDWRAGVTEMQRVATSRLVILTWDPEPGAGFWLLDYFPGILEMDRGRFPPLDQLVAATGGRSYALPVPHDCSDGFLGAWWREPAAYLDARLRAAMSGFVLLPDHEEEDGLARLDADISSGAWERRHGALREHEALDLGYRLVVAEVAQSPA
ncbi:MAG: class I SAM-dependent methyltransferase [Chloroflexi bacterium]|nr:class I SAM-dependent methyltransferase [Chloroflexota bacterium]